MSELLFLVLLLLGSTSLALAQSAPIRPEIRIEKAFAKGVDPHDNLESASGLLGTKDYQRTLGVDLIQWF